MEVNLWRNMGYVAWEPNRGNMHVAGPFIYDNKYSEQYQSWSYVLAKKY